MSLIIQFYSSDATLRAFPIGRTGYLYELFEMRDVDGQTLDEMGLPRIGKRWQKTDWGWQIRANLTASKSRTGLP